MFELWERRGDPVKQFSGGMRRRLEIARSFLHTPKIIFLDEPTLGLDPQTRNQLWTHVKKLNEDKPGDGFSLPLITWMKRREWPTGSPSSTTARSWRRERPTN